MKGTKNLTLGLPEPLLRRFRAYAAERNQSMMTLMATAIQKLMDQDEEYESAKRRILERMRNAPNLGTGGVATWTRDELHER